MSRIFNINPYRKQINSNAWDQAQTALKVVSNLQKYQIVTYHAFTINNRAWLKTLKILGKFETFTLNQTKFWPQHPAFRWLAYGRILVVVWREYTDHEELWSLIAKSSLIACSINGIFINLGKCDLKKINTIKKTKKSDLLLPMTQQFLQIINTNVFILNNIILHLIQVLMVIKQKKNI